MDKVKLFQKMVVRSSWDEKEEEWYFSVVDVVFVLTNAVDYNVARKYWNKLKQRLAQEGSELVTNCRQLKLVSPKDGKKYATDVLDRKGVLRLVQSIPSKRAEKFKVWLANVGSERLDEIADPEKAIQRGADTYLAKGYTQEWITQRLLSIKVRQELTDEWKSKGVENERDYAILTDEITRAWSGLSTKEYKKIKNLKKESLRDNITDVELILNMLAEVSTRNISQETNPHSFDEHKEVARQGGAVARDARKSLERRTGKSVISSENATSPILLDTKKSIN